MSLWSRVFVPRIVNCACASGAFKHYRQAVIPQAYGHVLEIGCGGGQNFALYNADNVSQLTALEPDAVMMKAAKKQAKALSGFPISFLETGAESLPLEDHSIDCAVMTFVLCTIPDWRAALMELKRVMKPEGKILFCEHGRSPDKAVAKWQSRLEPIWKPLAGGCHLTRVTKDMLLEAGFQITEIDEGYVRKAPKFAGYISQGEAIKALKV